jgi:CHASE2 domain
MAVAADSGKNADGPPRARSRFLRDALYSLLLASVALLFLNFNLAGTATPSKRFSQDLLYGWFGNENWLYPRTVAPDSQSAHGRPQVVVVVVNEDALAIRGARWPAPVEFHAQFLAELEVLRPRAIFLDFLLIDAAPREDVCDLLGVAAELRARGIQLYLAVTRSNDLAHMDAAACRDHNGKPLRVADVLTTVSVQRQADDSDFVSRRYPFEQPGDADSKPMASAAVRMYCDSVRGSACLSRLTGKFPPNAGFELAWSPEGDPFNRRWSLTSCVQTTSPMDAILNQPPLPRETGCPPVATLFAAALLDPQQDPSLDNRKLFDLVDGSFVMVGGNFRGSGDLVTTPLHTLVPGVYYHAVALQNLLAFEGYPKVRKEFRSPKLLFYCFDLLVLWILAAIFLWRERWVQPKRLSPFGLSDAAQGWIAPFIARYPTPAWIIACSVLLVLIAAYPKLQLVAAALIILTVIGIELRVAGAGEIRERVRGIMRYLVTMGASLGVIALAVWVGYQWLRLPPGDWLGYFSFAAFGYFVAHTAFLEFGRRIDELYIQRQSGGGNIK